MCVCQSNIENYISQLEYNQYMNMMLYHYVERKEQNSTDPILKSREKILKAKHKAWDQEIKSRRI